jgi:hypothetical protein
MHDLCSKKKRRDNFELRYKTEDNKKTREQNVNIYLTINNCKNFSLIQSHKPPPELPFSLAITIFHEDDSPAHEIRNTLPNTGEGRYS